MLDATYGMLAVLPVAYWAGRARDGVDPDAPVRRAANGEHATLVKRLRAKRAQKRREREEFKAWLQMTAQPL